MRNKLGVEYRPFVSSRSNASMKCIVCLISHVEFQLGRRGDEIFIVETRTRPFGYSRSSINIRDTTSLVWGRFKRLRKIE